MPLTLDQVEQKIRPLLPRVREFKSTIRFEMEGVGSLLLDGTGSTPTLSRDTKEAASTIHMTPENLLRLLEGSLDPMLAYTTGKLKIKGSTGVAMKLASILAENA